MMKNIGIFLVMCSLLFGCSSASEPVFISGIYHDGYLDYSIQITDDKMYSLSNHFIILKKNKNTWTSFELFDGVVVDDNLISLTKRQNYDQKLPLSQYFEIDQGDYRFIKTLVDEDGIEFKVFFDFKIY